MIHASLRRSGIAHFEIPGVDALTDYLEGLACLGSQESRGSFTIAPDQLWTRLRQSMNNGQNAPQALLRWLHAQKTPNIVLDGDSTGLSVRAHLPTPVTPKALDYAGADIDLARTVAAIETLGDSKTSLEIDDGATRWSWSSAEWKTIESQGQREFQAHFSAGPKLVSEWARRLQSCFRFSPTPITWNHQQLSGPYSFTFPALVWRHLRPLERSESRPLLVKSPAEALEQYRVPRHQDVEAAIALARGPCDGFWLLHHGELLPVPRANKELPGFGGVILAQRLRVDIQGDNVVENSDLIRLLHSFRDEAVDMALQLYNRESLLTVEQAESGFPGLLTVLLHLLDGQRFTEGHLLAEWLRANLSAGNFLQDFRHGYTFDTLCSLLAEPAGHPQTALRWQKQAEARLREQPSRFSAVREEALLINARLELRARRGQPRRLSGDLHSRLLQFAHQLKSRGERERAASVFHLLGHSFQPGDPQRREHFEEAVECFPSANYTSALTEEIS